MSSLNTIFFRVPITGFLRPLLSLNILFAKQFPNPSPTIPQTFSTKPRFSSTNPIPGFLAKLPDGE